MTSPSQQTARVDADGGFRLQRALLSALKKGLRTEGCALLIGPYEIGKSDLARELAKDFGPGAHLLNASDEHDRTKLRGDGGLLRNSDGKLIIIDDVHGMPEALDAIRAELDASRTTGRTIGQFLVLGSITLEAQRLVSERLGTNALTYRLAAIGLHELPDEYTSTLADTRTFDVGELETQVPMKSSNMTMSMETLWARGGFPRSLFAPNDSASFDWRERYIQVLCAKGYRHVHKALSATTVHEIISRVAVTQGQVFNVDRARPEQRACLDYLDDLGLVRRLHPWYTNQLKTYEKNPKFYIRHSGLLHCLLKCRTFDHLRSDGTVLGHSWEGFCIENLTVAAPAARAFFYRSDQQDEIDLVLEFSGDRRLAIEIKSGSAKPGDGFKRAIEEIRPIERGFVVRPVVEGSDQGFYREVTLHDMIDIVRTMPG